MNVIVCIKQVPAKIKIEIDPKTGTLASGGVDQAINPQYSFHNEFPLEICLRSYETFQIVRILSEHLGIPHHFLFNLSYFMSKIYTQKKFHSVLI